MFKKYVSNTACANGTSFIIDNTNGRKSYRVYVKPLVLGKFEWRCRMAFEKFKETFFIDGEWKI